MLTGKPAHLRAFNYTGFHRYSLTFCTDSKRRLFCEEAAVRLVLAHISSANCKAFISLAKQYSGYYYKREFGRVLWQRYGYERTLRKEDQTLVMVRYILENPVRAKLVQSVQDYPFVGSLIYELSDLVNSVRSG